MTKKPRRSPVRKKTDEVDRPYNALIPRAKVVRFEGGPRIDEGLVLHHLRSALVAFQGINDVTIDERNDFQTFLRMLERQVMARSVERGLIDAEG